MNIDEFTTRQEFVSRKNPAGTGEFIVGLDAGYSSMKVFSENGYFAFPSFCRKLDGPLTSSDKKDILYKDLETGEVYVVGLSALDMLSPTDTNDTDSEMFSRKRYSKKTFQILCNTALGIALKDKKDDRPIVIQTGLPSSFLEADAAQLKKAILNGKKFEIKMGDDPYFSCTQSIKDVFVIAQPAGSYYSSIIKRDGSFTPNASGFLKSNVLVMDIGFGTFDFYGIKNRVLECKDSVDNIGMRAVMKKTAESILKEYGEDIRINMLQKSLKKGTVTCVDEDSMVSEEKPIGRFVKEANEKVFREAMTKAKDITNSFRGYEYVIVTGGTGAAWYHKIKDFLSGMKTITVMHGCQEDRIPMIYANARGYYFFRLSQTS